MATRISVGAEQKDALEGCSCVSSFAGLPFFSEARAQDLERRGILDMNNQQWHTPPRKERNARGTPSPWRPHRSAKMCVSADSARAHEREIAHFHSNVMRVRACGLSLLALLCALSPPPLLALSVKQEGGGGRANPNYPAKRLCACTQLFLLLKASSDFSV